MILVGAGILFSANPKFHELDESNKPNEDVTCTDLIHHVIDLDCRRSYADFDLPNCVCVGDSNGGGHERRLPRAENYKAAPPAQHR